MTHLTPERIEALAMSPAEADSHLERCPECRLAITSARGRQRLLKGLTPHTLGEMAFRRVEARLNEAVEHGLPPEPFRWRWLLWSAPMAVAVAVGLVVASWRQSPVDVPAPRSVALVAAKAPWHSLLVTQASGDAQQRPGHEAWAPVVAGAVLDENVAVSGSKVVLSAPGWVFEASGSVALGGPATVALGAGTLAARAEHSPLVVIAGGLRLTSDESAFFVSRSAAEVVVDVFSGELEVGTAIERIKAVGPARVLWAEGTAIRTVALGRQPVTLQMPAASLTGFDVSELGPGTALDIDGQRVGITPLSLMQGLGRHRVQVTRKGQATRETWVDLVGGQSNALHFAPVPPKPEAEAPEVDQAALARVLEDLRRQTPKLRSCYEKWLKANPTASGEVELMLQVSATGKVTKASVKGAPISRESAECLTITARSLVLSPLGSTQELEVPLVLTPGR